MSTSIVIDLKLTGASSVNRGMRQVQSNVSGAGQAYARAGKQAGVFSQAAQKANALAQAYQTRDPLKIADAQYASMQANKRAASAWNSMTGASAKAPKTRGPIGAWKDLLSPFSAEIAVATAGLVALKEAAESSARLEKDRQAAYYGMYGAKPAAAEAARVGEGFSGISPGDWSKINDAIRGGDAAYSYTELARHDPSFRPRSGLYGDVDPTAARKAVIDYMTDPSVSAQAKQRMAYDLHQPGVQKYADISQADAYKLEHLGGAFDPKKEAQRDIKDVAVGQGWEQLKDFVGRNSPIYHALQGAGDDIAKRNGASAASGDWMTMMADAIKALTGALDKNSGAVRQNSADLKNGGRSGGGERAGNMPIAAWVHKVINEQMDSTATQLGGFKF